MGQLSIFVDESGDFGPASKHSPFYLLTFVLHSQDGDITKEIAKLRESLRDTKYEPTRAIHTGPLIRREDEYKNQTIDERRKQLWKLAAFIRKCDFSYKTFIFDKREAKDEYDLIRKISQSLSIFLNDNLKYFQSFDEVFAYYDNGQAEISKILSSAFGALLFDVEFRRALPADYFLLQAADYFCTLELLAIKHERKLLTRSERLFFYKPKELQKAIKVARRKQF